MKRAKVRPLVWIYFVIVAATMAPSFAQQHPAKKKGEKDNFLTGPPLTLQKVMETVPVVFETQMLKAIESRGVNFYPAPPDVQKLKAAGATDAELLLIEEKGSKFKPAVVVPPTPTTAGPLTITCAPAECLIEINGKPEGQTQGGVKKIASVPLGLTSSVLVDFKKEGFIGQQVTVALKPNSPAAKAAALAPTEATQMKFGGALLSAALAKLGGDKGIKDAGEIIASGRANLFVSGGQGTDWSVVAKLKTPVEMASLDLEGAGTKWWVSLRGSETKFGGSGKMKGTPLALETEKLVQQYRDFQPATLLRALIARKYQTLADSPVVDPASGAAFKASGPSETYTVTVGPNGLPRKVVLDSASGLGSGLEMIYADYAAVGAAKVPKEMDITAHGERGAKFLFDTVKASPGLKDKEFHR